MKSTPSLSHTYTVTVAKCCMGAIVAILGLLVITFPSNALHYALPSHDPSLESKLTLHRPILLLLTKSIGILVLLWSLWFVLFKFTRSTFRNLGIILTTYLAIDIFIQQMKRLPMDGLLNECIVIISLCSCCLVGYFAPETSTLEAGMK